MAAESTEQVRRSPLMTVSEVAGYLNVSKRTVVRMAAEGGIPGAVRVRKQWRFNRAKVERFAGAGE